jgi:hypothetical protein
MPVARMVYEVMSRSPIVRYQMGEDHPMTGENSVTVSQKEGVDIALRILKDALEDRGLNICIMDCHPFEILNSLGGLLGNHPGFDPREAAPCEPKR